MEEFEELKNAVVLQAVKDYRSARKRLKRHPEDKSADMMAKECESFFKSRYFTMFTSVDGPALLSRLEKE